MTCPCQNPMPRTAASTGKPDRRFRAGPHKLIGTCTRSQRPDVALPRSTGDNGKVLDRLLAWLRR